MVGNPAVVYSFLLYMLYVLLPLVPAILIFKLFPETKVTVSGPLQNLTINATGAFAAYVVTVALGFFLVRNVEAQITWTRFYPVQGVIVDLQENQAINSDEFYSRYAITSDSGGKFTSRDYYFVVLLDRPVDQTVAVKFWGNNGGSGAGTGPLPDPKPVPMKLAASSSLQRFRLQLQGDEPTIVPIK